ncbi:rod shape-determining protein MreD [bacterium]|nr:rod shape-determining protein MreD [bacterium]
MRRKRNQLILSLSLTALVFYFLQTTFINPFLSVGHSVPDLLLILTLFVGVRLGQLSGSLLGFLAGLLQDVLIDFYGLNALCKTVVGFSAKYFKTEKVLLVEKYYFPIVVFFSSIAHSIIFFGFQSLDADLNFYTLFMNYGLPNALYSAVMAFILWSLTPNAFLDFINYDAKHEY